MDRISKVLTLNNITRAHLVFVLFMQLLLLHFVNFQPNKGEKILITERKKQAVETSVSEDSFNANKERRVGKEKLG